MRESVMRGLRWVGRKIRAYREWASGDYLHDAQMNRGDDHEFHINPGTGM